MIRKFIQRYYHDIGRCQLELAVTSTAQYVNDHLLAVESVSSALNLLSLALKKTNKEYLICEFGVYSGRTVNHIAQQTENTVYGFDSFEGLPEAWHNEFQKGHFARKKLPRVRKNVELVIGWFHQTLPDFLKKYSQPVSFLHIDCDLYSSTKTIFDLIGDRIKQGCVIVFDEYFNYPGWEQGEFKAFHEFIQRTGLRYSYIGYNRVGEQVAVLIL